MHITPVLLKSYSFRNFLKRSNLVFVCFFLKKIFSPQKMFVWCSCLRYCAYLNSASNVFAYLLVIFLGHDWFGFYKINENALDPLHNDILAQMTPRGSN